MDVEDHGLQRLACLAIAFGALVYLGYAIDSGAASWLTWLVGSGVGVAGLFGVLRPDLVDFDGT